MKRSAFVVLLWGIISFHFGLATAGGGGDFNSLAKEYFDFYLRHNPSSATQLGVHDYDEQLEDYSKAEIQTTLKFLKSFMIKMNSVDRKKLTLEDGIDYDLIESHIQATLLDLESIRSWEKDPNLYGPSVSNSIFPIMSRTFASTEERLKSVIAREKQIPAVFEIARGNLKNPPRIFTQIALEQLPGTIAFFQVDVPAAFASVKDPKVVDEFKKVNQGVIEGLKQYGVFLKKELLPKSFGDFRLGAENFRKKLLYEEMLDVPLEKLLQIGMKNLRSNQEWFKKTAHLINSKQSVSAILAEMEKDHPPRDQVLSKFKDMMIGMKSFIEDRRVVTIPSSVLPIVEETPSFERALFFASMDTPGPFETRAKEAFFNVTLPELDWSAEKTEEYLAGFGTPVMKSTAIHEAYPGHYIQFLWVPKITSKTRKILGANSNIEGWAHYCEQMMLDEGFGGNDPKLRLGQLQDALLRNARFIVGLQMHTGKMTYQQGVQFFEKEGYQSHVNAERETKRGTSDPTYLYYTAGKLEILKLREDYKRMKGDQFSLQEFHDRFLQMGPIPISLIRRVFLGNEGTLF